MKIVHIAAPASWGGLESVLFTLLSGLSRRGLTVEAALVTEPGAACPLAERLVSVGVPVHRLEIPPRAYLSERRAVRRLCRETLPRIVHTHGYRTDLVDSAVARSEGIGTVSTAHGFTGGGIKNRFYERLQVRQFKKLDSVVAVSRPIFSLLQGLGVSQQRLRLIQNAWEPSTVPENRERARERLGLDDRFAIGWVGRLSHEKGPDVALESLLALKKRDVVMVFVGAGPMMRELQRKAEVMGIGGNVRWVGSIPDAARLFPAFDAFLLSSRTEGTPIVLFEAMSAGLPIVAAGVGGVPDVMDGGVGILVDTESPPQIADAVEKLFDSPEMRRDLGERARSRLSDFSTEEWIDKHVELYEEVGG